MGVDLTDAEAVELCQRIRQLAQAGHLSWDVDDLDNWPSWARRFQPVWRKLGVRSDRNDALPTSNEEESVDEN